MIENKTILFYFITGKFIVAYFLIGVWFVLGNTIGCIIPARTTEKEWKSYVNERYHFKIMYPADWKVSESPLPIYPDTFSVQVFFDGPSKQREASIRIYPKDDEGMIREALNIISETKVIVGGVEGTKIIGVGHKEGIPPVTMTLIRKEPYLYIFEGEGNTFEKILSTFTFIH